jgi:hypothetical protein
MRLTDHDNIVSALHQSAAEATVQSGSHTPAMEMNASTASQGNRMMSYDELIGDSEDVMTSAATEKFLLAAFLTSKVKIDRLHAKISDANLDMSFEHFVGLSMIE